MTKLTSREFLLDLAQRLMLVPVSYGVDKDDVDRLAAIASDNERAHGHLAEAMRLFDEAQLQLMSITNVNEDNEADEPGECLHTNVSAERSEGTGDIHFYCTNCQAEVTEACYKKARPFGQPWTGKVSG